MNQKPISVKLQAINRKSGNLQHYVTFPQSFYDSSNFSLEEELIWQKISPDKFQLQSQSIACDNDESYGIKLLDEFWNCWKSIRGSFTSDSQWKAAGMIAIGDILNTERHTLSQSLIAMGLDECDWNKFYRLFTKSRLDIEICEEALLNQLLQELEPDASVVLLVDDTQLKKSGKKIPGAKWLHDKLGPKFNRNLIWGQRFLQVSLVIPNKHGGCRSYPIGFIHCPVPKKPKKNAPAADHAAYKEAHKETALPLVAAIKLQNIINKIGNRLIFVVGDGGYTNTNFVRNLPEICNYLGRARKDAKLFAKPTEINTGRGRRTFYGEALPTPTEMYHDENIPFEELKIKLSGKMHTYKAKSQIVRSKIFGDRDLRLIIVAPVYYIRGSVRGHKTPLYLLTTDLTTPLEILLQYYLWRWEIELNFKDEKSVFGINEPQVHSKEAVETRVPFIAMIYSLFMLACHRTFQDSNPIPYAKWRNPEKIIRASARDYRELFRKAVTLVNTKKQGNKNGFANTPTLASNLLLFFSKEKGREEMKVS